MNYCHKSVMETIDQRLKLFLRDSITKEKFEGCEKISEIIFLSVAILSQSGMNFMKRLL